MTPMPTWEKTKRAGQTAFISQENSLQVAHASVDSFYRQILAQGYISPSMESSDLTQQIGENVYEGVMTEYSQNCTLSAKI